MSSTLSAQRPQTISTTEQREIAGENELGQLGGDRWWIVGPIEKQSELKSMQIAHLDLVLNPLWMSWMSGPESVSLLFLYLFAVSKRT